MISSKYTAHHQPNFDALRNIFVDTQLRKDHQLTIPPMTASNWNTHG